MMQSNDTQDAPSTQENEVQGSGVAVPIDLQVELAENRRSLAETRYQISVRKGSAWDVPDSQSDKFA